MDPVGKKQSGSLGEALESGKRQNGTKYDFCSGKWVGSKEPAFKVSIVTDPELHLKVGPSHIVQHPTPAMKALLEHKQKTGREPAVMIVTKKAFHVSFICRILVQRC